MESTSIRELKNIMMDDILPTILVKWTISEPWWKSCMLRVFKDKGDVYDYGNY